MNRNGFIAICWLAVLLAVVAVAGFLLGSRTVGLAGLIGCAVCLWPLQGGAWGRANRRDR
jgi:hypothetical protein